MAKKHKKKTTKKQEKKLSPIKYIKQKSRTLPIVNSYININYKLIGVAHIAIQRQHNNGTKTTCTYLVDLFCMGVRDSAYLFKKNDGATNNWLDDFYKDLEIEDCSYDLAHNIIFGGLSFAESLGLRPHKKFATTSFFLNEDTDDIPFIDVDFGVKTTPLLVLYKGETGLSETTILKKSIGINNFYVLKPIESNYNYNYDDLPKNIKKELSEEFFTYYDEMYEEEIEEHEVEELEIEEYYDDDDEYINDDDLKLFLLENFDNDKEIFSHFLDTKQITEYKILAKKNYKKLGFASEKEMFDIIIDLDFEDLQNRIECVNKIMNGVDVLDIKFKPSKLLFVFSYFYLTKKSEIINKNAFLRLINYSLIETPYDFSENSISYEPIDNKYLSTDEITDDYIYFSNKIKRFSLFRKTGIIKKMGKKYPNNPVFKQLKINYFMKKRKIDDVETDIIENYTNYNNYLFAKIQYATLLLHQEKYDNILEVFNNCNTLKELYPEREIFHSSEYAVFYQFFIIYYLEIKNIEKAQDYFDAIFKHINDSEIINKIYYKLYRYQKRYVFNDEIERYKLRKNEKKRK